MFLALTNISLKLEKWEANEAILQKKVVSWDGLSHAVGPLGARGAPRRPSLKITQI